MGLYELMKWYDRGDPIVTEIDNTYSSVHEVAEIND